MEDQVQIRGCIADPTMMNDHVSRLVRLETLVEPIAGAFPQMIKDLNSIKWACIGGMGVYACQTLGVLEVLKALFL